MRVAFTCDQGSDVGHIRDILNAMGLSGLEDVDFSEKKKGHGVRVSTDERRVVDHNYSYKHEPKRNGQPRVYQPLDRIVRISVVETDKKPLKGTIAGQQYESQDGKTVQVGCQTVTYEEVKNLADGMEAQQRQQ